MAASQTNDGYKFDSMEVIVGVSADAAPEEKVAVGEAMRSVCAHSQELAVNTNLWRVETYGGDGDDWAIALKVNYIHTSDDDLERLMNELVETPPVESVEQIF